MATVFGTYDLTDNIRLSSEWFYAHSESVEPGSLPIVNSPLFTGASGALILSTANPFLPAASRAAILAQPGLFPDPTSPRDKLFFVSRASPDIGTNQTTSTSDTYRGLLAIEGDLDLGGRNAFWNLSVSQGQNDGRFTQPNIDQARFAQAIDVIRDSSGAIVCRNPAARAAGCAPLNLFGEGAPSAVAVDYLRVQFSTDFKILQTIYQGNFGLDLAQLPAGPWSVLVGYEARYEKSDFNPNDPQERGVGRQAAISALTCKFHTQETYIETRVPLISGELTFPLMRKLEFEGAYRDVNNSQAGEDTAWSLGGRWRPIDDLMIRGPNGAVRSAPLGSLSCSCQMRQRSTAPRLILATSATLASDPIQPLVRRTAKPPSRRSDFPLTFSSSPRPRRHVSRAAYPAIRVLRTRPLANGR